MKRFPATSVLKQIGLGLVLVTVVVFLTLMFSLLGAISSAVVSGMILGAARTGKLRSILVSLVFPAVTLVMAHVSHALQERQNLQFSLICFGSYWIAYFLTFGIVLLERKPAQSSAPSLSTNVVAPEKCEPVRGSETGTDSAPTPLLPAASPEPVGETGVEELRGRWSCTTIGLDGQSHTKVMEIYGDRFALSVTDSKGRTLSAAHGGLRLEQWGPLRALKISNCESKSLEGRDESALFAPVWVYRIEGQTLTIALHLDISPHGPAPTMETYFKLPEHPRQTGAS